MATAFEATATYTAEVAGITLNAGGSATLQVQNRDANGAPLSMVAITIPADHAANVTHERTGDAGVAVSQDLADAIDAVLALAPVLMDAVIANEKHAL